MTILIGSISDFIMFHPPIQFNILCYTINLIAVTYSKVSKLVNGPPTLLSFNIINMLRLNSSHRVVHNISFTSLMFQERVIYTSLSCFLLLYSDILISFILSFFHSLARGLSIIFQRISFIFANFLIDFKFSISFICSILFFHLLYQLIMLIILLLVKINMNQSQAYISPPFVNSCSISLLIVPSRLIQNPCLEFPEK